VNIYPIFALCFGHIDTGISEIAIIVEHDVTLKVNENISIISYSDISWLIQLHLMCLAMVLVLLHTGSRWPLGLMTTTSTSPRPALNVSTVNLAGALT
jgi:hypothetical protein